MPKYVSYCAHCECIIDDDDDCDLHWFEKDFCSFECFKSYCLVSTMQCYECEMPVSSQVWYFVKSLPKLFIHRKKRPNSSECDNITNRLLFLFDDFIFCSEDCEKRHTNKHSLCGFCSIELEEEQPINDRSTAFCSPTCVRLMNIHLGVKSVKQAKCSVCRELKDVQTGMFWEGDKYVTCSDDCFRMFKKSVNTKCGKPKDICDNVRLFLRFKCLFSIRYGQNFVVNVYNLSKSRVMMDLSSRKMVNKAFFAVQLAWFFSCHITKQLRNVQLVAQWDAFTR